ncbi:MAG: arsenate reductase (glutaredoxin) [Proteobacteria bacterium]|jgi:arsenate reductase|nr:arsenate reductase (glutaredoxin) [Pseudomonadota bacterium]
MPQHTQAAIGPATDNRSQCVDVTLYHNPRCSKSRETLALLEARGITPTIIEYLQTPPSAAELRELLAALGIKARALVRDKEAAWAACAIDDDNDETRIIAALVAHPELIERPIVVAGTRAVLGRPPSNIDQLFA